MKKIGRNEPCPCGSGKKFKHCHLGREDELVQEGTSEFTLEMSARITSLPSVAYGRSREMIDALDIKKLTGSDLGVRCIDLNAYGELEAADRGRPGEVKGREGAVVVNTLKTGKSDPDNIYVAISPEIEDSTMVHQLAHVLDYLNGSKMMPGVAKPLSFDLGVPVEHLEHPYEFGYWLDFLYKLFDVRPDADDAIISYLYENAQLIRAGDIEKQDGFVLKSKSERILQFLSERGAELDALICELPGYIGSRAREE
jgi:SEC-C motif-containing protein